MNDWRLDQTEQRLYCEPKKDIKLAKCDIVLLSWSLLPGDERQDAGEDKRSPKE